MNKENTSNEVGFWGWIKRILYLMIALNIFFSFLPEIKKMFEEKVSPKLKVGWIDLKDEITDATSIINEILYFQNKPEIPAVILRVDSGGGAAGSSELISRTIKRLNNIKPVFTLVENICASGAYMIACSTNKIFAQESSVVGSIGVGMRLFNFKRIMDNWNIDHDFICKGEYKGIGDRFSEKINEKQKKYILQIQDGIYDSFVEKVATERGLNKANHKQWADGKIFNGKAALAENLIDEIGDLESVYTEIKQYLNDNKEIKLIKYPRSKGFSKIFQSENNDNLPEKASSSPSIISSLLTKIMSFLPESWNWI